MMWSPHSRASARHCLWKLHTFISWWWLSSWAGFKWFGSKDLIKPMFWLLNLCVLERSHWGVSHWELSRAIFPSWVLAFCPVSGHLQGAEVHAGGWGTVLTEAFQVTVTEVGSPFFSAVFSLKLFETKLTEKHCPFSYLWSSLKKIFQGLEVFGVLKKLLLLMFWSKIMSPLRLEDIHCGLQIFSVVWWLYTR